MDNEILDRVELKDGTEIRSYRDDIESESPLAWNDDIKYYTNAVDEYNTALLPTYNIESLKDDYKGKKNVWISEVHIACDSCPGMYLYGISKLNRINLAKYIDDMSDSGLRHNNSQGLLVFKAKDEQEAKEIVLSIKKNMDTWLSGDIVCLHRVRPTHCESCGHDDVEDIDSVGCVYLDYSGDIEQQIVEAMGLDISLIKE